MHSTLVRAQNVFGFFTTVAFCVAALIALSTMISPQSPSGSIKLRNVQVIRGRPHYYSKDKEEYAHIKFDLDADLSTLFTWNTKQVFLYISASYPSLSPSEPPSQAIIWDAIIPSLSAPWHQNQYIHPSPQRAARPSNKDRTPASSYRSSSNSTSPGHLHLSNQRPKYQITDVSGAIAGRANATLELGWNVQPWVGALAWASRADRGVWTGLGDAGRSQTFAFPALRGKGAAKEADLRTERGGEGNRGKPA